LQRVEEVMQRTRTTIQDIAATRAWCWAVKQTMTLTEFACRWRPRATQHNGM
jgi:hypothetical protein